MFTVLRMLAPADELADLGEVVRLFDVEPLFRRDGYVIDICEAAIWAEHAQAVLQFVQANRNALTVARSKGATLTFDVAVEPDDIKDQLAWLTVGFPADVIFSLAEVAAQLAVTVYAGDSGSGAG